MINIKTSVGLGSSLLSSLTEFDTISNTTQTNNSHLQEPVKRLGTFNPLPRHYSALIPKLEVRHGNAESLLTLDGYFKSLSDVPVVIILHKGKVVYETGTIESSRYNQIWMLYRPFLCYLVLSKLNSSKIINIDRPVSIYMESLKGSIWDFVSFKDILLGAVNLSSILGDTLGLANDSLFSNAFCSQYTVSKCNRVAFLQSLNIIKETDSVCFEDQRVPNPMILIILLETILNLRLDEYVSREISYAFHNHLLSNDDFCTTNSLIEPGLPYVTAEEFASYLLLFTSSFGYVAKQKLPLIDCVRGEINGIDISKIRANQFGSYASHHEGRPEAKRQLFMHSGMEQGFYVDSKVDLCAVFFGNYDDSSYRESQSFLFSYFKALSKLFSYNN